MAQSASTGLGGEQPDHLSGRLGGRASAWLLLALGALACLGGAAAGSELPEGACPPGQADLFVVKTDTVTSVQPGDPVTYTITVGNNGPTDVPDAGVTDLFDPQLLEQCSWTCVGSDGGGCTAGAVQGDLVDVANLPRNSSAVYTALCTVATTALGTLSNTASIGSNTIVDCFAGNDASVDIDNVVVTADLSVTKSASPSPVSPGATLTYTIVVTNNGPSTALDIVVTDTLPAGVSYGGFATPALVFLDGFESGDTSAWDINVGRVPIRGSVCTESGGVVTCLVPSLASGESVTITLVTTVDLNASGTLVNTVTVSSDLAEDVNLENNTATVETPVVAAQADLSITIDDDIDPVSPGGQLVYLIGVTAAGPSPATDVQVFDFLPPEVSFFAASEPTCDDPLVPPCCTLDLNEVTCHLGDLGLDGTAALELEVSVSSGASGAITNPVLVDAAEPDPNPGNNTATEVTTVCDPPCPDMSLAVIDAPDPVAPGGLLTYSVAATNNGPGTASGVRVIDTLPAQSAYTGASVPACGAPPSPVCCELDAGQVTCYFGTLVEGFQSSVTLFLDVDDAATGILVSPAQVESDHTDIDPTNNAVTSITTVCTPPC